MCVCVCVCVSVLGKKVGGASNRECDPCILWLIYCVESSPIEQMWIVSDLLPSPYRMWSVQ